MQRSQLTPVVWCWKSFNQKYFITTVIISSDQTPVINRINQSVCYLTVEADSSSSGVSVDVQTSSPLIHLGVVVTVERVPVTVTRWKQTLKPQLNNTVGDSGQQFDLFSLQFQDKTMEMRSVWMFGWQMDKWSSDGDREMQLNRSRRSESADTRNFYSRRIWRPLRTTSTLFSCCTTRLQSSFLRAVRLLNSSPTLP